MTISLSIVIAINWQIHYSHGKIATVQKSLFIPRIMASPFANTNLLLWAVGKESAGMIIVQVARLDCEEDEGD